jgi:hypothetical protein
MAGIVLKGHPECLAGIILKGHKECQAGMTVKEIKLTMTNNFMKVIHTFGGLLAFSGYQYVCRLAFALWASNLARLVSVFWASVIF